MKLKITSQLLKIHFVHNYDVTLVTSYFSVTNNPNNLYNTMDLA